MKKFLIPLALFMGLVVFLAIGLKRDPREIPSPLVNKQAPDFSLPTLNPDAPKFSPKEMLGKVWMLNVWATWCVACRAEHPVLVSFAKANGVPIVGLSYKEIQAQEEPKGQKMSPEDKLAWARKRGSAWLRTYGDPYVVSVFDMDGRVGIDYGVYGVPESYVIDKAGGIRFKQIGEVTPEVLSKTVLPLIQQLNKT